MKKLTILTVAAMLTCGAVWAAENAEKKKGPREMPGIEQRMEMMTKQLELTTDQQAKVKALFEQEGKEMREARAKADEMTVEQRREKMMARRESMDAKLKEILTPEQFQKLKEHRQNRGEGKGKKGEGEKKEKAKE
jgi:Spy/CpxP family protein refolding chaperone